MKPIVRLSPLVTKHCFHMKNSAAGPTPTAKLPSDVFNYGQDGQDMYAFYVSHPACIGEAWTCSPPDPARDFDRMANLSSPEEVYSLSSLMDSLACKGKSPGLLQIQAMRGILHDASS